MTTPYDFSARSIEGSEISLSQFRGRVLLIVNTASQCGFTPQYAGLQQLQHDFSARGFTVLAFPCNQFGRQEPGADRAVQEFCSLTYNITFPVFFKIDVNGSKAHPLFRFLKKSKRGILGTQSIKWNFTKFLIDRNGVVIKRYAPVTPPLSIRPDVEWLLNQAPV